MTVPCVKSRRWEFITKLCHIRLAEVLVIYPLFFKHLKSSFILDWARKHSILFSSILLLNLILFFCIMIHFLFIISFRYVHWEGHLSWAFAFFTKGFWLFKILDSFMSLHHSQCGLLALEVLIMSWLDAPLGLKLSAWLRHVLKCFNSPLSIFQRVMTALLDFLSSSDDTESDEGV